MRLIAKTFSMVLLFISLPQAILAQARIDRPPFFEDGQEFLDREIQRLEQQQQASPDEQKPSSPLTIEKDRERERERGGEGESRGRGDGKRGKCG
jgi:hypothetical protein